jgi:hypothetical protein
MTALRITIFSISSPLYLFCLAWNIGREEATLLSTLVNLLVTERWDFPRLKLIGEAKRKVNLKRRATWFSGNWPELQPESFFSQQQ